METQCSSFSPILEKLRHMSVSAEMSGQKGRAGSVRSMYLQPSHEWGHLSVAPRQARQQSAHVRQQCTDLCVFLARAFCRAPERQQLEMRSVTEAISLTFLSSPVQHTVSVFLATYSFVNVFICLNYNISYFICYFYVAFILINSYGSCFPSFH